jgi:hypothetical protein
MTRNLLILVAAPADLSDFGSDPGGKEVQRLISLTLYFNL